MITPMTEEELYALPVSFDLETAGHVWGFGRTKSHQLARAKQFPCTVLRFGGRYVVTKLAVFEALGLPLPAADTPRPDAHGSAA